jgi:hypothetical protein
MTSSMIFVANCGSALRRARRLRFVLLALQLHNTNSKRPGRGWPPSPPHYSLTKSHRPKRSARSRKRKEAHTPRRMTEWTNPHSEISISRLRRDSGAAKLSIPESNPSKSVAVDSRTSRQQNKQKPQIGSHPIHFEGAAGGRARFVGHGAIVSAPTRRAAHLSLPLRIARV